MQLTSRFRYSANQGAGQCGRTWHIRTKLTQSEGAVTQTRKQSRLEQLNPNWIRDTHLQSERQCEHEHEMGGEYDQEVYCSIPCNGVQNIWNA